jgi:hypothetical protein
VFIYIVSIQSGKICDKSNSYLSNVEIWDEDKSPDDSKQFIENFNHITTKKKSSQFKFGKNKKARELLTVIYY